jgi:cytochrome c oxidase subunit 3
MEVLNINSSEKIIRTNAKKFGLYLAMASMTMFFTSMCSALIVKRGDFKHWEFVHLPHIFMYSTLIIIVSSVTIQLAYQSMIDKQSSKFKLFGYTTIILSIVFLGMQYMGWQDLKSQGVFLKGNPSGSFIYLISGLHAFHYIFGIMFLMYFTIRKNPLTIENIELNTRNAYFNMLSQYWHYIGLVWVFLFLFFKFFIYN